MFDFDDLDEVEEAEAVTEKPPVQEQKAPNGERGADVGEALEFAWLEASKKKLQAFRDGSKYLPPKLSESDMPKRLKHGHPAQALPPFRRLPPAELDKMSEKNLPGHFTGLEFPHNTEQLRSFGAKFFTKAFHKFGTLSEDNEVTKVVKVEQLPHSGFDAAGGAGHKSFVTLEYKRSEPNLHTELFAKFPWGYHESDTGKTYRTQISTYADMDAPELLTYMCCEHLLPCRIPKLYFCDINRDTTNYMLILERIPFGKRGRIENNRIVEKIERKPFEVLPVCGKYQDYLLDDPATVYYSIFREMAHIAAWDHQGHFDAFFGEPLKRFTPEEFLMFKAGTRKQLTIRKRDTTINTIQKVMQSGKVFATQTAAQIFPADARDPKKIDKMIQDIAEMHPQLEAINDFMACSSDYIAAAHMNLQADNAFFWKDEKGDMDCGVFDWCGFARNAFVANFMGCLSGADVDLLDAHEEGLMKMFCDEYERYGGPHLDWKDLLLRYHLRWPSYVADCVQWIERDILRECPTEEWPEIKSMRDNKFVSLWNVRCRGTALVTAFSYWHRRNFRKIFDDWAAGPGKRFLVEYK